MSIHPSQPAADAVRRLARTLRSIGFDPTPRPVWPVVAQTLPAARLAFRPAAPRPVGANTPAWARSH